MYMTHPKGVVASFHAHAYERLPAALLRIGCVIVLLSANQ